MSNSNSHNHEKIILKALKNLSTDRYSTVTAAVYIYILLIFILAHHFHSHQS